MDHRNINHQEQHGVVPFKTIEIDLRQMLGEQELPKPIAAVNGVLM